MTEFKNSKNMLFLHKEWHGYPVGTPFMLTKPTSEHLFAKALVGVTNPMDRYVKLPCKPEEVFYLPYKDMLEYFGDKHPNCPSVTGPFVQDKVFCGVDKLSDKVVAQVTHLINYPNVTFFICFNTTYLKEGYETYGLELKDDIPKGLRLRFDKSTEDIKNKVVNSTLYQTIEEKFGDLECQISYGF